MRRRELRKRILVAVFGAFAAISSPSFAADTYTGAPIISFTPGRLPETADCGPDCADFIVADGEIASGSSLWLLLAYKKIGDRKAPLVIHSPGGSIEGGLALGRVARKLGLTIIVARATKTACGKDSAVCQPEKISAYELTSEDAWCLSACSFVFAGGVERFVPRGALVGVHLPRVDLSKVPEKFRPNADEADGYQARVVERWIVLLTAYLKEVGVDTRLIDFMKEATPDQMRVLTASELALLELSPSEERKPPLRIANQSVAPAR